MTPNLTSSLVVSAAAQGSVVWYTIHPSASDKKEIKTIRFSELDEMHGRLSKEVPTFPGRLPPKTLKKNTKPNFIEIRRKAIETYLRLVSADELARASVEHQFFDAHIETTIEDTGEPNTANNQHSSMHNSTLPAYDSEGEEESTEQSFTSSVNVQVRALLQSKRNNLTVVQEKKESLEGELETIWDSVWSAQAAAKEKVALESEAAARLRAHRESLAEHDMQLSLKNLMSNSEEKMQSEMAKRLLEELQMKLQMAMVSKDRAQMFFDVSSKAAGEAATKAHAKVAAATAAKVEAEGTLADTRESHSAMEVAMSVLQVQAKVRLDDVNIAERELVNLKSAIEVLDAEIKDAEDLRQKGEVLTKVAEEALASHIEESACRTRAHQLVVTRATECATDLATLRDMRTRGLLMGVDRISLEPAENSSNVAAEAAAEALAQATQAADETKSTDECQLEALQAAATMANKTLRKRETVVASFAANLIANKVAMEDASTKLAAAVALNSGIQQRFAPFMQQVETLAQSLPECLAKLAEATMALATVTKEHESELLPLRQAEIVESQVLKERKAELAALVKAEGEAQIAAAEAAAAVAASMEGGRVAAEAARAYKLVKSSEARFVDLDKAAEVAAHGHKASVEALDVVKSDLAAIDDSSDDENDEDDNDDQTIDSSRYSEDSPRKRNRQKEATQEESEEQKAKRERKRVALWSSSGKAAKTKEKESKIKALEKVVQDKKNIAETAAVAAQAAHDELDALQAQQKSTLFLAEALVKQEIELVDSGLMSRKDNEVAIVAEVEQQVNAWKIEQVTLDADLHRTQLLAASAEGDVTVNKNLAKSLTRKSAEV